MEAQIHKNQLQNELLEQKEIEKIPKDIQDEIQKNLTSTKKIKDT